MKLNNSCLKLALAALMILLPGIAWGGTTYYYKATLTANASPTAGGKVYVDDKSSTQSDIDWTSKTDNSTKDQDGSGENTTSKTFTFYVYQQANAGYEFKGWNITVTNQNTYTVTVTNNTASGSGTSSNRYSVTEEITAYFSPIPYKITYELGGGTNNSINPDTYTIETDNITLGNPTRPGYKFTGWTLTGKDGNGNWKESIGSEITTITKGHYGAITLTAVWAANDYKIKFEPNGGTFNGEIQNPLPYKTSNDTISLPEITREGFTFTGWTASFEPGDSDHGGWDTSTGKYGNGQTITTENKYYGNVTLTAGWEKEAAPSFIRVNVSGMLKEDHAIFNISYDKQGQTVNQQIAIHEYAIVKIPGGVSSVTVMPSKWTEKTYTITPPGETTQDVKAGNTALFNFSATPKSGQNIFETSREF